MSTHVPACGGRATTPSCMAFSKAARKLKRTGKVAHQFRCTSVFEYIELVCNEKWYVYLRTSCARTSSKLKPRVCFRSTRRPDQLRIVWQRNSRKVNTIPVCCICFLFELSLLKSFSKLLKKVRWEAIEDRGTLGASGKALFDVKLEATLIITLYQVHDLFTADAPTFSEAGF